MRFCGLSGWEMENFIICGQHFTPECYLKPLNTLESIQERPKLYNCGEYHMELALSFNYLNLCTYYSGSHNRLSPATT